MKYRSILTGLLVLGLLPAVALAQQTRDITTPGTGFEVDMDYLAAINETVIKGSTPPPDSYTDYFVEGRIYISPNDRLTIRPGERLVFRSENSGLVIEGRLDARGQAVDDIVFTSLNDYLINVTGVHSATGWNHLYTAWKGEWQIPTSIWADAVEAAERNYRVIIDRNHSAIGGGSRVRVKFQANSANDTVFEGASIGVRSASDFQTTPTRLKFSGANSVVIPAGDSVWSDWATFNFSSSADYLVHLNMLPNHSVRYLEELDQTHQYYKDTSAVETMTPNVEDYLPSDRLSWVEEIEIEIPNLWSLLWTEQKPDRVFFNRNVGREESSLSRLDADREWYWEPSSKILFVYSTANPETGLTPYGIEVGYYSFETSGSSKPAAVSVPASMDSELSRSLTSDMETTRGIFQITTVTGVVAASPKPAEWDALEFDSITGKSFLKFVTIHYADIGVYCNNIVAGMLDIEHCTIENNHTGIYLFRASPLISENPSISYNKLNILDNGEIKTSSGAGIFMERNSNPLIRINTIQGNEGIGIIIHGITASPLPRLGQLFASDSHENVGRNNFLVVYKDPVNQTGRIGQRHITNETPNTIYAHRNFWGVTDPSVIDSIFIFDDDENPSAGPVEYLPFYVRQTEVSPDAWDSYR